MATARAPLHTQAIGCAARQLTRSQMLKTRASYFRLVEIVVNVVFNWVPKPFTTAMIATEMPAAINPYSIAVAPDSFFRKVVILDIVQLPLTV